jgi:hypothetical protein
MDCCCSGAKMTEETSQNACNSCGEIGRIIARQTVVHHVKGEKLGRVKSDEYKFCPSETCSTVYYSVSGEVFTVDDVRELVTSKTKGDKRPLCYCFGFTEGFARLEIEQTGETSISKQISQFIKEKLCVCEIRNPAGACCLGEINRTVKRLAQKSQEVEISKC